MERNSVSSSILGAAAQLLKKVGYQGSNTNYIAKRAGVSVGSLYYHFRNKDAIFQKLMDEIMTAYTNRLAARFEKEEVLSNLKTILIDEAVDHAFENRKLFRTLFSLAPKLKRLETVYRLRNQFSTDLSNRFQLDPADTFIMVNAINGVLDNYIYSDECQLNRDEIKEALNRLQN